MRLELSKRGGSADTIATIGAINDKLMITADDPETMDVLSGIFAEKALRAPKLYVGAGGWEGGPDEPAEAKYLSDEWFMAVGAAYLYKTGFVPHLVWED
jgi:hypothetical protein